ncbi:MAG: pilin [Patescibacteria group bacterium]
MKKAIYPLLPGILLTFFIFIFPSLATAGKPVQLAQGSPSDYCNNPQGMAAYYGVPYPAQKSPQLIDLINCVTTNAPAGMIDVGKIYTTQQIPDLINYTRGVRDCNLTTDCAAAGSCHAVSSCHYGGATGPNGAEGVDFNASDPTQEIALFNAINPLVQSGGACHGKAKFIALEGDHTHMSTAVDAGCDSVNIAGVNIVSIKTTSPVPDPGRIVPTLYIPNPLKCGDLLCVITDVIRIFLGLVAVFGTAMLIWGGFTWILSAGNPERTKKGKDVVIFATVGIVIVILSWAIINYILAVVSKTTFK